MKLIESFEKGGVNGFGTPDKVIETMISKLFFFGNKVVKVYKIENYFFANLADSDSRKKFYEDDFFWNNTFSPEIYQLLVEHEGDFYIQMKRVDADNNLTSLLQRQEISIDQIQMVTIALIEKLRSITLNHRDKLGVYIDRSFYEVMKENMNDLREWLYLGETYITKEETVSISNFLEQIVDTEAYFKIGTLCATVDNNGDNLLFIDEEPSFIDIMTPKENWRVLDETGTIARTAVDAYVLGNKELSDAVYSGYANFAEPIPKVARLVHEVRAALIQFPYRHTLGQHEVAEKYKVFALEKINDLKNDTRG